MKKQKQNDCVDSRNKIQRALYEQYKKLTDEERELTISRKLTAFDSPIAGFWRQNVLRIADEKAGYKCKNK